MACHSVTTASRPTWESPVVRANESPPRKWLRGVGEIDAKGEEDPWVSGGGSMESGTQSSTKGGTSDTAVEVENGSVFTDSDMAMDGDRGVDRADKDGKRRGVDLSSFLLEIGEDTPYETFITIGPSDLVGVRTDSTATWWSKDEQRRCWRSEGQWKLWGKGFVVDKLISSIAYTQHYGEVILSLGARDESSTGSTEVFCLRKEGEKVVKEELRGISGPVIAHDHAWIVYHDMSDGGCMLAKRMTDAKSVKLKCRGSDYHRKFAAGFLKNSLWILNFDFGCVEIFVDLDTAKEDATIEALCVGDLGDVPYDGVFKITSEGSVLAIKYESWIAVYDMKWAAKPDTPSLQYRWSVDLVGKEADEADRLYVSAFDVQSDGAELLYLQHYVDKRKPSVLKAASPGHRGSAEMMEDVVCIAHEETWELVKGGEEDILRHLDYVRYQDENILMGRHHSCLWMSVSTLLDGAEALVLKVETSGSTRYAVTVKSMKENVSWKSEWLRKTQNCWRSMEEVVDRIEDGRGSCFTPDIIRGDDLEPYLADFNSQPKGDRWTLEYGFGLRVPTLVAFVKITQFMNFAVIRANFPTGPKYLRLDRYHEKDEIREKLVLRFWNQADWECCLDEVADETEDGSRWELDVDRLDTEEAAERERQAVWDGLQREADDAVPSRPLWEMWLRLGMGRPELTSTVTPAVVE
ncbi:hypothetical protein CALVIDRAFT_524668 [Calocera viscosa TUFC12733]|uniref:Uncharacterized protein n=1 Tax=Calocera viscosa (strain TUFC12733) TaxID=1330018 RepID=A0A167RJN5_CALVF|nr:hypothetical protein CALVIDRAFT_524668 [Calocera viscosa TUFC12733]